MARATFYSQAKNSVVISAADGFWTRVIKDYAEGDDCIAWEPLVTDQVTAQQGLDKTGISIAVSRGGKVTIKLKPTSKDCGALNKIVALNNSEPQLVNVSIVTGVDEKHKLSNAGISRAGSSSGGPTMQAQTFTIVGDLLDLDETE